MIAAAALALAAAMSIAPEPDEGVSAQNAAPEPSVMIVEFPRGAPMIGFPGRCPGEPPEGPNEPGLCLAELYQGRVQVLRHLAGPTVGDGALVRLTAHARRWRPGQRLLVATISFEDRGTSGQFAWFWHPPEPNGNFCVATKDLHEWDEGSLRAAFEAGERRRFRARGFLEPASLRCIGE